MNNSAFRIVHCATVALAIAFGVSGCEKTDPASYVASARSYIAKADYKAAIIEAKNALQQDPNNGEARVILATALLEGGDAVGAEAEIRKAMALNFAADRTYPLLALALAGQGQFSKLTDELATRQLEKPAAQADLDVSLAIAYFSQGDPTRAGKLLDAALAAQPKSVRALLFKAELAGQAGDLDAARNFVESALEVVPNSVDALMTKANISTATGKTDEAQQLLEQAIAAHPEVVAPRFVLLSLAVTSGKIDVAKEQLAKLKQLRPRDIRTSYSEALIASAQGDATRARDAVQRVLAVRPDHLPSVLLSGLIDYQLGSYQSAEASLQTVIARVPEDPNARRVLALIYLRKGLTAQALETLDPALRRSPDNPLLLRTAGEAYLASGNAALATRSYERANAVDKTNIGSQVRLAQVRLAAGDTARALNDLESLAATDSAQYQAELALYTEHMRRREYDKALDAVAALEKKQPKSVLVPNLRGTAYLAKRDVRNARINFEQALELQPDYLPAAQNLALIDLQEGKPQAARERYERMLAKSPRNEQLLLASAELNAITGGAPDQVKATLEKAIQANPTSVRSRLAMINFDLRQRDGKAAAAAAQSALNAVPNDPRLLDALGTAQRASGEAREAVETYRKAVELQPQNPALLLRLADAQVATKDYPAAIENQRKALTLKPDLAPAWAALVKTYLISGRPEVAIAEARKLQKEQPDKSTGYALEAELLSVQKKWPEAAAKFREALARQPVPLIAARTYVALQSAGKSTDASAFGAKWMKDHPKDPTLPQILAEQSQRKKDYPAAIAGYERVLTIDPDNVAALNNLAWLLNVNKDAKALEYAEHAHRLAPFNSGVLDTLGWILTGNGDAKRAVPLLRMASSLAPAQDEIRLHLAQALADSGDKAGARKEIVELTKPGKNSPMRDEAEKLQATLAASAEKRP